VKGKGESAEDKKWVGLFKRELLTLERSDTAKQMSVRQSHLGLCPGNQYADSSFNWEILPESALRPSHQRESSLELIETPGFIVDAISIPSLQSAQPFTSHLSSIRENFTKGNLEHSLGLDPFACLAFTG
jgi:hypothetical protein